MATAADYDFTLAEDIEADREDRIAASMRYHKTSRRVAEVMVDTGYSKGTANRILIDAARRKLREDELAEAAAVAAKPGARKEVSKAA